MADKVLTLEEATALNVELKAKNVEQAATIKDLNKAVADGAKREEDQLKQIESLKSDVGLSEGVVDDLKTKILGLEAKTEGEGSSKTIHKLGKKKYRLLYSMRFGGLEITDEALAGNEKLLKEIVDTGSGALQEVL